MILDIGCGLWIAASLCSTLGILYVLAILEPARPVPHTPRVAIIAPVKGAGPYLAEYLQRLRAQDYAAARIVVVVEDEADPAHAVAVAAAEGPGLDLSVLVAGRSDAATGQKVWNLLAALDCLAPDDEIVAFVDADTLPGATWLRRLVGPIVRGKAAVVTGYRWLLPDVPTLGARLVAAVDQAIASSPRLRFWNVAWGGTVAMPRSFLEQIDLAAWWRGAMSDDMQLTRAVWAAGVRLVYPDGMLVASPVRHDTASAFEFGRRQHVIARTHLPTHYLLPMALVLAPVGLGCCVWFAALRGDGTAIAVIAALTGLAQIRYGLRRRLEAWVLRDAGLDERPRGPGRMIAALAPLYQAACVLAALTTNRVRWGGVSYEIVAPQTIDVARG